VGRDVGRDEGRDQAAWRDLVARLELMSPIDPADAPWPDRENLSARPSSGATRQFTADDAAAQSEAPGPAVAPAGDDAETGQASPASPAAEAAEISDDEATAAAGPTRPAAPAGAIEQPGSADGRGHDAAEGGGPATSGPEATETSGTATKPERRPPVTRSRIIRPAAGYPRFGRVIPRQVGPSAQAQVQGHGQPQGQDAVRRAGPFDPLDDPVGFSGPGGPRDFQLADDSEFDFGDGDRYIPPPLPPLGRVDPVVAGGWLALFGGPAYLLISMVADWQAPRWTSLVAVLAFVTGFLVLVFRLGDGPSKRDGPDQGAVV
jgi:hypothetical protein